MLTNNTLLLLGRLVVEQFEGVEAALLGCEFERVDQLAYRLADVIPLNWTEVQAKHLEQIEDLEEAISDLEEEKQELLAHAPKEYADDLKELLEEVRHAERYISSSAGEIESRIGELEQNLEDRISQLTRRVR